MYKTIFNKRNSLKFNRFSNKSYYISTPGHVRRALEAGAAGVIVGSALVKIVSEHLGDRDAMLKALGSAAASFKAAT